MRIFFQSMQLQLYCMYEYHSKVCSEWGHHLIMVGQFTSLNDPQSYMYADWSLVLLAGPAMLKRSKGRDHTKSDLLALQVGGGGGGRRNTNRGCHCWGCNDALWTKPAGHPKANRPNHQLLECEDHGRGNKGTASTCSYGDERVWDWSARDKWGQARTHALYLGQRVSVGRWEKDHNYLEKDWGEREKPVTSLFLRDRIEQ